MEKPKHIVREFFLPRRGWSMIINETRNEGVSPKMVIR